MTDQTLSRGPAWFWGGAFFVGMFGTGFAARALDLGSIPSALVMIPPMLLLIPLVRASEKAQAACGALSPATRRYNRRGLIWAFGYVIFLFVAVFGAKSGASGPLLWLLALLPALPIFFMLWTMARYLVEETDEYLRMRVINAALWATGLLLAVATVWGFLETFELVPHVPGWAAVPVWAVGLGASSIVNRWREA
ncbi:hypothetical protein QUC32_25380 [Novosphingobium resinovorum]|uniref:hypothetical protein n=1 Tax=Novosphingobium TaxID=165696 RepID=UPI001B3C4C89|nr:MULTISPECIES: hypothetical protein [Novosphingobium]MBF7012959.1 hypothetical protein [Novosphingobium sp. HR1a]WJM27694.1 hypothetical protein QUC32_25380 [Novosphingobium resinovorum]